MGARNTGYTSYELEELTGVKRPTIFHWTRVGMLMPPKNGHGPYSYYTDEHVRRIEDIKELKDNNRTNRDLRDYFNPEDDDDE